MENGLELYHCEFVKRGQDWFLRCYIDFDRTVMYPPMICEDVSRFLNDRPGLGDPIDAELLSGSFIAGEWTGSFMNQTLEKIQRKAGRSKKLYKAVNEQEGFTGTLMGLEDGVVIVKMDDGEQEEMNLLLDQAAAVRRLWFSKEVMKK